MKQSIKGEIIVQLLRRFPKASTHTIAQKAFTENPEVFKDTENARDIVRWYRGAHSHGNGKRHKSELNSTAAERKASKKPSMPKGLVHFEKWEPYQINGPCKCGIFCDIHAPYHDPVALKVAVEYVAKQKPTHILLNGDVIDCFGAASFRKDPRKIDWPNEIKTTRELLGWFRAMFPKAEIIYKWGNHEDRWDAYMIDKAPMFLDVDDYQFSKVMRFDEFKIVEVKDCRPVKLGPLCCLHGHEYKFNISNPVNPARGLYLRSRTLSLCGHFHQTSQDGRPNLDGKLITAWSVGCLCQLRADYRPINDWNHGGAIVTVDAQNAFRVENFRIIDGKVY